MSLEVNKVLVRRAYDALGNGDWATIRELVAPNFVDHNPVQGQSPTVEGFLQSRISLMKSLAEFKSTI